jgi:outer membrane biosynthesis protein TonB
MIAPEGVMPYYFNASVRLGETGVVVLHFSIGPDGKAREPITHDEPFLVAPHDTQESRTARRLIEGAERYIRAARFEARGIHKRRLTASFVFEVKPCGTLEHSPGHDYTISLCREQPAIPSISPHGY